MTDLATVSGVLEATHVLMFDFDGPICSVFSGYPAHLVARELSTSIRNQGADLPPEVADDPDPLEILRWSANLGDPDLVQSTDDMLRVAETKAVEVAEPTAYAHECIRRFANMGRSMVVVSNNSAECVRRYLELHDLHEMFDGVVGRAPAEPHLMKPNPFPILKAMASTGKGTAPEKGVLIGDSLTDIAGARAAGTRVIAYANKPRKVAPFTAAAPDVLIRSMAELLMA